MVIYGILNDLMLLVGLIDHGFKFWDLLYAFYFTSVVILGAAAFEAQRARTAPYAENY